MDKETSKLEEGFIRNKHNIKNFTLESDREITQRDAIDHMIKEGFHPSGYGLHSFKCGTTNFGSKHKYIASWICFTSCD